MGEDDRKEMYEYFVNCSDNLQIENEQLADSLFGEDADGAEDGDKSVGRPYGFSGAQDQSTFCEIFEEMAGRLA